jgi:hypothetical protein
MAVAMARKRAIQSNVNLRFGKDLLPLHKISIITNVYSIPGNR